MNSKVKMAMLVIAAIVWDLIGVYLVYMAYQAALAQTGNVGVAIVAGVLVVEIFFILEAIIIFRWVSQLMPMMRRVPTQSVVTTYNIIVRANDESYSDDEYDDCCDDYDEDEEEEEEEEEDDGCNGESHECEFFDYCFPERKVEAVADEPEIERKEEEVRPREVTKEEVFDTIVSLMNKIIEKL